MTKDDVMHPTTEDVEKTPVNVDGEHYLDLVVVTPTGLRVDIPMISVNEPVSIIKQSLTDFRETAYYTNFHLTILDDTSGVILNDFIEIANYPLESGSVVVMNFDDYDVKRARVHLKRVREFILAPPISRGSIQGAPINSTGSQRKKANKQIDKKVVGKASTKASDLEHVSEEEKGSDLCEAQRFERQMTRDLLPAFESIISGANFSMDRFFKEVLFRTGSASNGPSSQQQAKLPSDCVKSLAISGWNPPPSERKMQGDLLYVEAVVDEGTLHITCVAGGFYVSRSSRHNFDPRPAVNSFYSHDLFNLLLQASASFSSTWTSTSSALTAESKPGSVGTLDLFATLFSQGRGDFVSLQPQWNASPTDLVNITSTSKAPSHTYEVSRAQDDLLDGFGVEEKGVQREWNEEIQAIRSLSVSNLNDKILKSRLIYKVITEFSEACKVLVLAIADGHIAPLNMSDSEVNFVYVYNGIFISRAVDSKDTFKLCKGDEANRKSASHDMNNQKLIQSLEFDEISSVLCAIVDFRGDRYIGQTIIPGILSNSKNSARLMYGILEPGKRITVKKDAHAALKKIYEKLYIKENEILAIPLLPTIEDTSVVDVPVSAPDTANQGILGRLDAEQASPIRVDDLDELSPLDSITSSHVGPIEGKILEGSDGRLYALEILRLTPRDSNYLKNPQGTGKIAPELLELTDEDATTAYLLRHELVSQFTDHHVINLRNAYLQSAVQKYKALVEEQKSGSEVKPSNTAATNGESKEASEEESVDLSNFRLTQQQIDECNAISVNDLGLVIDPNCFFEIGPVESDSAKEVKMKSEETARKLATFLFDTILPAFTKQIRQGELLPLDCDNMVQLMHKFGINVRYLGQLGNLARDQETEDLLNSLMGKQRIQMMPYYWLEFLETEMIARTFKVVLYSILRSNTTVSRASASTIASMLNHVLGVIETFTTDSSLTTGSVPQIASTNSGKSSKKKKNKGGAKDSAASQDKTGSSVTTILDFSINLASSRDDILKSILDTLVAKFSYAPSLLEVKIKSDGNTVATPNQETEEKQQNPLKVPSYDISSSHAFVGSRINKVSLLRRICQQAGLRVITKDYDFNSANPFAPGDIIALVPKVKTCEPPNLLENSVDLLERAKEQLQEKNIAVAFEMAQEASNITQQIVGPLHKNSLRAIEVLTTTLLSNGDVQAAIGLMVKSLIVGVQLYGLDCPETLTCHSQLSVYFAEMKNYVAAIQHGLTALYLAHLLGGASHPEFSAMLLQLSQICRAINEDEYALQLILLARNRLTDIYKQSMVGETLAEIYMRTGRLDDALLEQRHCSKIISDIAGDDTTKAKASKERLSSYLRAVTQRNVDQAKERQAAEALQKDLEWIDTGIKKLSGPGGKAKKSSSKSRK